MKCLPLRLVLALVPLVGCAVDEPSDDDRPLQDDDVFYQTVVTILPDGTQRVSEPVAITVAEEREQNEARRAHEAGERPTSSISQDVGCTESAIWIYSRTDFYGDKICFRDTGTAYLFDYPRYVTINGRPVYAGTWALHHASIWPGKDRGYIGNGIPFSYYSRAFVNYGPKFVIADGDVPNNGTIYLLQLGHI